MDIVEITPSMHVHIHLRPASLVDGELRAHIYIHTLYIHIKHINGVLLPWFSNPWATIILSLQTEHAGLPMTYCACLLKMTFQLKRLYISACVCICIYIIRTYTYGKLCQCYILVVNVFLL